MNAPLRSLEIVIRAPTSTAGLAALARTRLGLDARAARKLAARSEFRFTLFRPSERFEDEISARLERVATSISTRPAPRDGQPCELHPALAALDVCPRCEARRACSACLELASDPGCPGCQRAARRRRRFRNARVAVLLGVLAGVAFFEWRAHREIASWARPVRVAVFPVPSEPSTAAFAASLSADDLEPISQFLANEAERHGLGFRPLVSFAMGEVLSDPPPATPSAPGVLEAVAFSLALRWWAFTAVRPAAAPEHEIRIALVLHPSRDGAELQHSVGLARGRVGVVHAFADRSLLGLLRVVTAHELLHIAGATDKYGPNGVPAYPEGYVDPRLGPGPRPMTEIMAGTRVDAEGQLRLPRSLEECGVGAATAREIGWVTEGER